MPSWASGSIAPSVSDHPFQPWKQADFRGLAAFFGKSFTSNLRGVRDGEAMYHPLDRKTKQAVTVEPLADQMGSIALIRSMVSKEGDHGAERT